MELLGVIILVAIIYFLSMRSENSIQKRAEGRKTVSDLVNKMHDRGSISAEEGADILNQLSENPIDKEEANKNWEAQKNRMKIKASQRQQQKN